MYISLPLPFFSVIDRGGFSESCDIPMSHRWSLFSLGPSEVVRGGGSFASLKESFGGQLGQLYLSGLLIVTVCLQGSMCILGNSQNLTLCFRLLWFQLCCRWILCLFSWVGSLIRRKAIIGVVGSFQRLDGAGSTRYDVQRRLGINFFVGHTKVICAGHKPISQLRLLPYGSLPLRNLSRLISQFRPVFSISMCLQVLNSSLARTFEWTSGATDARR